jgi:hypothetical protein
MIHLPEYIGDWKPDYNNYPIDIDGGHAWTINSDIPEPEMEELDQVWVMPNLDFGYVDDEEMDERIPDELNFGEEEVDNIITPEIWDQFEYDFDYIDPLDPDGPPDIWDYGYYFNSPDLDYEYTFEDDEDYDFYHETEAEDTYDIKKTYDYNRTYSMPDRDEVDEVDDKGNPISVTETLLRPTDPNQFIPPDLDFGEEDDETINLPQATNLYGVDVIDFGYHSDATASVNEWDYGITYPYTEYTIEHANNDDEVGEWYPWSDFEPEYYTKDIDGNPVWYTERTNLDIDGGKDEWTL